ncbi:MAG: hypothetical protein QOH84_3488 [Kribbellaceae bacterium]|jgi:hypothetical protein|nr:hypothetical protein [Kribbellaceae bacterium]
MPETQLTTPSIKKAVRKPRDVRGFWRVLLAVVAPLPMLFMGIYYLISPVDGDASFKETLAATAADPGRFELMQWLQVPFFLLIPAMFAAAWVSRRRAPRLATAGGLLAVGGMSAGFFLLDGVVTPTYLTVHDGLDASAVEKFGDAVEKQATVQIGGLLFILAVTFGLLLLGIALWRSKVAPAWMGIALAFGGFTHPFMPGHLAAGAGLVIAAIGFAGASYALLRSSNDTFDLPPLQR